MLVLGTWIAISLSTSSGISLAVSSTWNSSITSSFCCCAWHTSGSGTSNTTLPSAMNMSEEPLTATAPQLRPEVDSACSCTRACMRCDAMRCGPPSVGSARSGCAQCWLLSTQALTHKPLNVGSRAPPGGYA